jgi:hypothetical protein
MRANEANFALEQRAKKSDYCVGSLLEILGDGMKQKKKSYFYVVCEVSRRLHSY